jgi:hypothetical protein
MMAGSGAGFLPEYGQDGATGTDFRHVAIKFTTKQKAAAEVLRQLPDIIPRRTSEPSGKRMDIYSSRPAAGVSLQPAHRRQLDGEHLTDRYIRQVQEVEAGLQTSPQ